MNYEQIAEKLKPLASNDKTRKALMKIAVKDNIAVLVTMAANAHTKRR